MKLKKLKKDTSMQILVSSEDKALFNAVALYSRRTLSDFVRVAVLDECKRIRRGMTEEEQTDLDFQIRGWSQLDLFKTPDKE